MSLRKHIGLLVFLVFLFSLNPQLSFSSSSNVTLANNSPLMLCHPFQSHALLQFISTFNIDTEASYRWCPEDISYPKTESWKEGTDCCSSWDGVTCNDVTGHVIGLDLSCSKLEGTIHSNNTLFSSHIAPHLQRLNLAFNNFTGSEISSEFWVKFGPSLTHLNLSQSGFSGNISPQISHLSNLVSLDLSYNFGGLRVESDRVLESIARNLTHLRVLNLDQVDMSSVHASSLMNLSSSLTSLRLGGCGLQGEFPVSILVYPNLEEVDLSYNNFNPVTSLPYLNSTTPTSSNLLVLDLSFSLSPSIGLLDFVGNYHTSLRHLSLSGCSISGPIPPSFGNLTKLTHLSLAENHLSGPIPQSLGNLLELTHLSLAENHLSGPIPQSLGNLIKLTVLDLGDNHLIGPIPLSLGNLIKLTDVALEYNHLSGPIPPSLGNLIKLTDLALEYNHLSGPIPPSLGNLIKLTGIDLGDNHLSGPIPPSFSNLTQLTYLDLSHNHFNGPIPTFFFNLTHLTYLDMSDNELEGPLPSYLFALPLLDTVDLSNNKLYGHISTSPIKCMNLFSLVLSNNSLSGSLDFDVFLSFNKLTTLDLSRNNISSSISASTHSNFTYSLPGFSSLDLSGCILNLFPTFIKALTNLTELLVSNSQIQGSIPDWIYDVGKDTLQLVDLSENSLTGVIGDMAGWKNIKTIYFSSNLLQGSLPIIPTTVVYFSVSKNNLSGVISSSICNLSGLSDFDLSYNKFTGSIPQCLVNIFRLDLGMNELHGVIPNTFATDSHLTSLVLKGNQLTGPIPSSLSHCVNLGMLDLSNNMIEDTIPHWLNKLSSLEVLILRSNKFFGSLNNFKPTFFSPSVRILDLSNNNFDGQLPMKLLTTLTALTNVDEKLEDDNRYMIGSTNMIEDSKVYYSMEITAKGSEMEYVKILTTFSVVDLSRNKFEGHIPREIGKLVSLKGLNLSHNMLTGHIPSSMGNSSSLEWLDLSSNKLNGQIPKELTSMTFLSVLNLSHNQLDGPIPQGKQFDTFTNDSYKDNLALCGLPLSKSCGKNHEPPSAASENKEYSDSESGFNWAVAFSGYGCGIVLGLSIGYIVFESGTPKWFVRMVDGKKQRGRVGKRSRRGGRRRH